MGAELKKVPGFVQSCLEQHHDDLADQLSVQEWKWEDAPQPEGGGDAQPGLKE